MKRSGKKNNKRRLMIKSWRKKIESSGNRRGKRLRKRG